jgi:VWFA-related protein
MYQLSVNVDLVVLNATLRDRKGRAASELRQEDFEIFEDGVRQTIRLFRHEDIPVTVGLVIDHSGSMRAKLASVTAAAHTFIQASSPDDQMFVVNFNEDVTLGLPPSMPFTNRQEDLT